MHQTLARCPEGKASSLFRRQLELYRTKPFLQPVGSIEFPSASLLCVRHCSGASEVRLLISVQRKLMGEKRCPPRGESYPPFPPESLKAEKADAQPSARLRPQELAEYWHTVDTYRILTG